MKAKFECTLLSHVAQFLPSQIYNLWRLISAGSLDRCFSTLSVWLLCYQSEPNLSLSRSILNKKLIEATWRTNIFLFDLIQAKKCILYWFVLHWDGGFRFQKRKIVVFQLRDIWNLRRHFILLNLLNNEKKNI